LNKTSYAVELHDVSKSFGDYQAISGASLKVDANERVAILGPNGAGKSTLLRIIAGILSVDRGYYLIDGYNAEKEQRTVKSRIGYLPDEPPLYDLLNPIEQLEYVAALWGLQTESAIKRSEFLLQSYSMEHTKQVWMKQFSKGMRQKIGLISVLIRQPSLLILDEPFTALDSDAIETTIQHLNNREYVRSAVIVSHDLDLVERVADRALIMNKGKIVQELHHCNALRDQYEDAKRRFRLDDAH